MSQCTMGVGCDEYGVCYAEAHGDPTQCPLYKEPNQMNKLLQHFKRMQAMAGAYLEPDIYKGKGGELSTWDDGLERPDLRAHLFVQDMLEALDGPEQREAELEANNVGDECLDLTVGKIHSWAEARNLIEGSDSFRQLAKTMEELGETAGAIARGKQEGVKDGIGDVAVTLIILAAQNGLTFADCVAAAYDEIKDRKGVMRDGIFIKEE